MVKQVTSIMYFAKEVAVKKGRRQDLVEVSIRDAVAIAHHDFMAYKKKLRRPKNFVQQHFNLWNSRFGTYQMERKKSF
jgi:hypothetical protein